MSNVRELAQQFYEDHPFLLIREEAKGLCLWSVLVFAALAAEHGFKLYLVRWSVRNWHFNDHWAIKLGYSSVIDFTRAQVDEKRGHIFSIDDYPSSYFDCRIYPASLFLDHIFIEDISHSGQIRPDILRKLNDAKAKYDHPRARWCLIECLTLIGFLTWCLYAIRY